MQNGLQKWVLEEIAKNYTKKSEVILALSKLLSVGKDAIYRRFRCETILAPEELELLARTYKISLDQYIYNASDTVFFSYSPFVRQIKSFEDYMLRVKEDIENIAALPNHHVKYASPAIPVFYLCFIPELLAFKLYTWGRTTWELDYLQDKKFDFDLVPYPILKHGESITDIYIRIASTELWSLNLIDFSINQIEYYVSSFAFAEDSIALVLCDKLKGLLNHMEVMAAAGQKFKIGTKPVEGAAKFDLYHNEMLYTDHTVIISSDLGKGVYASFGNPDFIKSNDQRIAQYVDDWFEKILKKSQAISTHAEKTRKWFFARLRRKVDTLKSRIENQLVEF